MNGRNGFPIRRDTLTFCSYGEIQSDCYLLWLNDEQRNIDGAIALLDQVPYLDEPLNGSWTDNQCAACGRVLIEDEEYN
tara:strand:- start:280 stop:516 length:237 start_codon:yes stop_codon:yes gene_type:complete